MAVELRTGNCWYPMGGRGLLHAFFSTIAYHLEDGNRGSKYPSIMKELYQGELCWDNVEHALCELRDIQNEMKRYNAEQIIWDINDLSKRPPWNIHNEGGILTLSDDFILISGVSLFDVFQNALVKAKELKTSVRIVTL